MELDSPSRIFLGVHFVLFGFTPADENEVRSKLIDGCGTDVGQYSQSCTHVIVDKLVYDDPVCVAARNDGKTLVTSLWVDHSFDIGLPVDATSVMYRPLIDLNGIPGAKRLIMCLTGYQRQDRDDVMTMVNLMGAQFSKPLVANKVTHLICYKFEGDKYEVARKLKTIRLVNHRWLEDCLRNWKLLPEANYSISGYELEINEAEAKDSEDETDNSPARHIGGRNSKSPCTLKLGVPSNIDIPKSVTKIPSIQPASTAAKDLTDVDIARNKILVPGNDKRCAQTMKSNQVQVSGAYDWQDAGFLKDATHAKLVEVYTKTPECQKMKNEFTSCFVNAEKPPYSDGKSFAKSYSRKTPWKATLPLHSRERLDSCSKAPLAELTFRNSLGFDNSLFRAQQGHDQNVSNCVETPQKRNNQVSGENSHCRLYEKRSSDLSYDSSAPQKMSHETKSCAVRSPANDAALGMEIPHFSLSNDELSTEEYANLSLEQNSRSSLAAKPTSGTENPLTRDLSFSRAGITDIGLDNNNAGEETPLQRLKNSPLSSKPDILDFDMDSSEHEVRKLEETGNQDPDVKGACQSEKRVEADKLNGQENIELLIGEKNILLTNLHRKKTIAKKSVGSRLKIGLTTNKKGSIHFSKGDSPNDDGIWSDKGNHEKSCRWTDVISTQTDNDQSSKDVERENVTRNAVDSTHNTESVDDETEAPENNGEMDLEKVLNQEKIKVVQSLNEVNKLPEQMLEKVGYESSNFKANALADATVASENFTGGTKPEGPVCTSVGPDITNSKQDDLNERVNKGKKRSLGKPKARTSLAVTKSKERLDAEVTHSKNIEEVKREKMVLIAGGPKTKSRRIPAEISEKDIDFEKENKPLLDGDQNIGPVKQCVGKPTAKPDAKPEKISPFSSTPVGEAFKEMRIKHTWFILSGHRVERKMFQQLIRRLKGRFCRDSHQWSYQATHFVTPDPVRRTEKFFAAAASGRWVLKTDYLTASSEAGQFLAEEPYEWYKNGLSEDGAINLEAPRKWRLLRERTGHGAFYGMRIIIHGECIAPPLDTLKRVVKAGDGIILATSPPYTRFLNSGVDFAIISPGMPRVDIWVQEFLNHEIPCVVADYLVEYVCKPGYPLEKHVLYNTNAWAEKSFSNLQERSEEIVEVMTLPDDSNTDDIACEVCGSRDRGEVMLICGDEKGSIGCGIGMHIDCCNPPLEEVPEDDWFCPECITSKKQHR